MDNGPDVGGFGNDSDDDAIPIIPDLEDVRDEDMQLQVRYHNLKKTFAQYFIQYRPKYYNLL